MAVDVLLSGLRWRLQQRTRLDQSRFRRVSIAPDDYLEFCNE
jgi:hypothetical protein